MASNQPAYAPARPEADTAGEWDGFRGSAPDPAAEPDAYASPERYASPEPHPAAAFEAAAAYQAAPGYESEAAADAEADAMRSQHRLPRQRGTVARGSTVLGIAAMAAVGTGGLAVAAAPGAAPAADTGSAPISAPDVVPAAQQPAELPAAAPQPLPQPARGPAADRDRERTHTGTAGAPAAHTAADPGEALRARIVGQATAQRDAAAQAEREVAERAAAREAAARKVREQAAAAKAAAQAQAKADAEAAAKAETERLSQLARSYLKPLGSATLTAGFGESDLWANLHTGQDFTAPTGTPAHAIHSGTVTSAGWAGAYGYRVVLSLDDGTELWYCHLSTMVVTSGRVITGDTIGRVGATGNVPEPHLHLEVRPGGGDPVDPLAWLAAHDVAV